MTPTNLLGLPEPFVAALAADDYDRGDSWRTMTELIGPARIAALRHAHPDQEDVEDIADRIHLLWGKTMHKVLELAGTTGIREQRLYAQVGGQRISGQFDHLALESGLLSDYKSTSVFTVTYALANRGLKRTRWEEWEAQLNGLAYLCELAGYAVSGLEVNVVCDGWSRRDYKFAVKRHEEKGEPLVYPAAKVCRLPIPLWGMEETQQYLTERVNAHLLADDQVRHGQPIVHCTPEERWLDPPTTKYPRPLAKRCLPGREGYCPMRSFCVSLHDSQHGAWELGEP